jgi:drug/metabolite transporter (DMT)-like permease
MSPKNTLLLTLLAALWGASFLFMRVATPEFGAFALVEVRVIVASLLLLLIWSLRSDVAQRAAVIRNWRGLLLVGLLNSAVPFVLFAWSTLHITGGFASIMNSTAPVWTALVAWAWLQRKPNLNTAVGLALGLVGVFVLVSGSSSGVSNGAMLGVLAATCAAFFYGVAANYVAERLPEVSSLSIATFSLLAAALILAPFAVANYPTQSVSVQAWSAVIAMGIISTALANIIYFYLLSVVGSTKAITVTFLIPVFGTLWGVLFINEQITSAMLIGGAIILLGTALVTGVIKVWRQPASAV